MIRISRTSEFDRELPIAYFCGKKNFDEAIREAREWAEQNGLDLVKYYEQKTFGRTILVSYRRKK